MHPCHRSRPIFSSSRLFGVAVVFAALAFSPGCVQQPNQAAKKAIEGPWLDRNLPPDKRADLLVARMTLDEKLSLVHGQEHSPRTLGGAGFVPGVPRLGIPDFQMTDGRSGVGYDAGPRGRYATAMPSSLAAGASWDLNLAYEYGALLGKEVRDLGFNVSLGGTANLIREPRNGRNFECWSEDPIATGRMLGRALKGTQDQVVIGDINRYAVNDQENGRVIYSANLDKRSLRETDLLAFQIAIQESDVGTVMCAYSKLNGVYDCENPYLLDDVLKKDWGYKGWVMSDWGAVHSTVPSARAGFDQEMPSGEYFGATLRTALDRHEVPTARLNDMVHRILRTEFAVGTYDHPPSTHPVNPFTGAEVAQYVAEQSAVLLKNANRQLPLQAGVLSSIAIIGSHADVGVLSGAGSDQVAAAGGNAVARRRPCRLASVLAAAGNSRPSAQGQGAVRPRHGFRRGREIGRRLPCRHRFRPSAHHRRRRCTGSVPAGNQDQLVHQVAAANPHTIVVLETGGPVTMPWIDKVSAVLEVWYPGIRGGEATANLLFGTVNPSGKLPVTFPRSEADLPHPVLPGTTPGAPHSGTPAPFDVNYTEGLKAGYKWFDAEKKEPLFPFGFGLSYTAFSYSQPKAAASGQNVTVSFNLRNSGPLAGAEIAQVYVALPAAAGEPPKRLVAWDKLRLAPGESKALTLTVDPLYLSIFNVDKDAWELVPGDYQVYVGASSRSTALAGTVHLAGGR